MFCRNCGQKIKEGTKYCVYCGSPVSLPEQKKVQQTSVDFSREISSRPMDGAKKRKILSGVVIGVIVIVAAVLGGVIRYAGRMKNTPPEDGGIQMAAETENVSETAPSEAEMPAETENREDTGVQTVPEEEDPVPVPHTYQIVIEDVTWLEAWQKARQLGGYLVNINSEEEWQEILDLVARQNCENYLFWIGARRDNMGNSYHWVDGNGSLYGDSLNDSAHWMANEPSFYDSEADEMEFYVDMYYFEKERRFIWNDVPNDISLYYKDRLAYIVEFEPEE